MKHRHVVLAALVAGALGLAASRLLERPAPGTAASQSELLETDRRDANVARVGDALPALELPDPSGRRVSLRSLVARRPAIVNVWASWCRPCLEEMPALDAFQTQQGANGVQVVGIALDDAAAVRTFLAAHPVRYPILVDAPGVGDAGVRLGNPRGVLPYSVLVSADGRILRQWAGPLAAPELAAWVAAAHSSPTAD